jgi:hypothetical protein
MDRFELALLADRSIERPVVLSELIARSARAEPWPDVRLDDTTLLFETGDTDWMPVHSVLGELAHLAPQLAAAAERLRTGELALLRPAVDDRGGIGYLLFEPDGAEIAVTIVDVPSRLGFVYPTAGARAEELYAYVREHRRELLADAARRGAPHDIVGARMARDELIAAMEREAERADQVLALAPLTS